MVKEQEGFESNLKNEKSMKYYFEFFIRVKILIMRIQSFIFIM